MTQQEYLEEMITILKDDILNRYNNSDYQDYSLINEYIEDIKTKYGEEEYAKALKAAECI